ncbi:MAG: SpoIVB peptidase [Syntrophomonadaceae bacterium]|nr:SpoIVB peptidase [Syntrophomonadaceae bacterium]MDD3023269.1 SpoIVB peptidase [Syntrophomonadaceae bacterium]
MSSRIRSLTGILLSIFIIGICFTPQAHSLFSLPAYQKMVVGESSNIFLNLPEQLKSKLQIQVMTPAQSVFAAPQDPPITISKSPAGYEIMALKPGKVDVRLNLLGYIPIKSMAIESIPTRRVVAGGHSIGVLLQSRGIMVVGYAPVLGSDGQKNYPARDQGVEIGDLIQRVDGKSLATENELANVIDTKKDQEIILTVKRANRNLSIPIQAAFCSETNRFRIGLYVRDGVVGVGTLSFWDPDTSEYAALGHIIVDADTKQGIDVLRGKIVSASVQSIKPGKPGQPGEKIGIFDSEGKIEGNITKNCYFGIFGKTEEAVENPLSEYTMEVAYAHQVKVGKAQIFTVVNGSDIEKFDVQIEKVYQNREDGKSMVIRVVDPRLLSLTGGIIQGMSGSPIIQDNKIVGAITHVFLNDPARGYGIFMDNMLSEMPGENYEIKRVSTNY